MHQPGGIGFGEFWTSSEAEREITETGFNLVTLSLAWPTAVLEEYGEIGWEVE